MNPQAVIDYRTQTTGSENIHQHSGTPVPLVYTDGIATLAKECGAYWLIDLVASHQPAIRRRHGKDLAWFQVWRLEGTPTVGAPQRVTAEAWSDTPGEEGSTLLARQRIEYSDIPRELLPLKWYVEGETMLFPEER